MVNPSCSDKIQYRGLEYLPWAVEGANCGVTGYLLRLGETSNFCILVHSWFVSFVVHDNISNIA